MLVPDWNSRILNNCWYCNWRLLFITARRDMIGCNLVAYVVKHYKINSKQPWYFLMWKLYTEFVSVHKIFLCIKMKVATRHSLKTSYSQFCDYMNPILENSEIVNHREFCLSVSLSATCNAQSGSTLTCQGQYLQHVGWGEATHLHASSLI